MSFKKGQIIQYSKEIMFKGSVTIQSEIIAVTPKMILLENGDSFYNVNLS